MTAHPIPDVLTIDAPEQPATIAGVMFRLAAALEILPPPISIRVESFGRSDVQLGGAAEFEAWRQWLGAPDVEPGEWEPYQPPYDARLCRVRWWKTFATWRGHTFTVVRVEMAAAEVSS